MLNLKLSNREKAFIKMLQTNNIIYSFDLVECKDKNHKSRYYDSYDVAQNLLKKNIIKCYKENDLCWVLI